MKFFEEIYQNPNLVESSLKRTMPQLSFTSDRLISKCNTKRESQSEIYSPNPKNDSCLYIDSQVHHNPKKAKHLIVLVHGFQASRMDFLLLKSCLEINYDVEVMLSFCKNMGICVLLNLIFLFQIMLPRLICSSLFKDYLSKRICSNPIKLLVIKIH